MRRSIERFVGSDVHDGEWHLVLLFFANLFLLLTAYYILKVIREPLILMSGGAVSRSYARGMQAGLLVLAIPLYSYARQSHRAGAAGQLDHGRVRGVPGGVLRARDARASAIGFAFFVWLGIFSTFSIAQFWSLAIDVMTESEGKRLFPLIAAGGTIGGIARRADRGARDPVAAPLSVDAGGGGRCWRSACF